MLPSTFFCYVITDICLRKTNKIVLSDLMCRVVGEDQLNINYQGRVVNPFDIFTVAQ